MICNLFRIPLTIKKISKLNSNKIAIRCLTAPQTGYGNFRRCLYLAETLRKKNIEIYFIIDYNTSILSILRKKKFPFTYNSTRNNKTDSQFVSSFLSKNNISNIIIDMRDKGEKLSKFLSKENHKQFFFDDAWSKKVYADILFNGTNVSDYHNYVKVNKSAKLFLNTKYWIVPTEFSKFRKKLVDIKQKRKYTVIISMGGSDPNNITSNVIESIKNITSLKIIVIVGPFFSHLSKLRKITKSHNNIKLIKPTEKLWKEFSRVDIAISNGGNTLFELATMSVPTLTIPGFKHEIKYAEAFMSDNFSINLGFCQSNKKIIHSSLNDLLSDLSLRKKMCVHGKKIVDGKGLSRVVKIILKSMQ